MVRSLNQGTVGSGDNLETLCYQVPPNTRTTVSVASFTNTSAFQVLLTVVKNVGNTDYPISPYQMIFPAGYSAYASGITLSNNDRIKAISNVPGAIVFAINGNEIKQKKIK